MSDAQKPSALQRKAQLGQERLQTRAMTAARALRVSWAKVAEREFDLASAVIGLTEAKVDPGEFLSELPDTSLILLLDTPDRGPGAAFIDPRLAGGMVQQQTMGSVSELPPDAPLRKPTRTDAALVGPFLDRVFLQAGGLPEFPEQAAMLTGLKFGAHVSETRLLSMALEAPEYTHFALTVDVASGTRQGRIDFLFPQPAPDSILQDGAIDGDGQSAELPPQTLEDTVMGLHADVRVALCRLHLPLSGLTELTPGDTLELPADCIRNAEAITLAGRKITSGKLGQAGGHWAFRPHSNAAPMDSPMRRVSDGSEVGAGFLNVADDGSPPAALPKFQPTHPSDLPALTTVDDLPVIPDLPDLPDLPDIPGLEDELPDLPDLDGSEAAPHMPAIGAEETAPAGFDPNSLPDLPDLSDLAELPELKQA